MLRKACRLFGTLPTRHPLTMDELLSRCVPQLPPYEARGRNPPPPELQSQDFMARYRTLEPADRAGLLRSLATDFGREHGRVAELCAAVVQVQDRGTAAVLQAEDRLRHSLCPRYRLLFSQLSAAPGGVKFLLDVRADLLQNLEPATSEGSELKVRSGDFAKVPGDSQVLQRMFYLLPNPRPCLSPAHLTALGGACRVYYSSSWVDCSRPKTVKNNAFSNLRRLTKSDALALF